MIFSKMYYFKIRIIPRNKDGMVALCIDKTHAFFHQHHKPDGLLLSIRARPLLRLRLKLHYLLSSTR